jgi:hypothetical protein
MSEGIGTYFLKTFFNVLPNFRRQTAATQSVITDKSVVSETSAVAEMYINAGQVAR